MSDEAAVRRAVLLGIGSRPDFRVWTNPTGVGWQGAASARGAGTVTLQNPRRVAFGLTAGGADLIGIRRVIIAPEDVGRALGVFCAIELKDAGRATAEQLRFLGLITDMGGLAGVARSLAEAERIIDG